MPLLEQIPGATGAVDLEGFPVAVELGGYGGCCHEVQTVDPNWRQQSDPSFSYPTLRTRPCAPAPSLARLSHRAKNTKPIRLWLPPSCPTHGKRLRSQYPGAAHDRH